MKFIYIITGLLLILTSCSDILDKRDLSALDDEIVWGNETYAAAYLNKLYLDNLPGWPDVSQYSDEAYEGDDVAVMYGQLSDGTMDAWYYSQIRNINILIQKIEAGTLDDSVKKTLKGQAYVLRAWRYFQMVRLYGGVPLILEPQTSEDNLLVSRNKTSECIAQIISDLDNAIASLPEIWTEEDLGRITKGAAMALKGRVLLFYASPQFNPSNDMDRWQTAYTANFEAKESLIEAGYGLYENYEDIWFDEMNKEDVWVTRYEEPGLTNSWNASTRPLSEAQNFSGSNHPTLEMVESYPMLSGLPISDPSSCYDPVLFFKNRDPRFNSTIAYNSCLWELSGKTGRRQYTYPTAEANSPSETGYYCRKAINVSYTPYYTERSSTDWIEIRFAEVLMNFAECAVKTGKTNEAYEVLKQIRKRAGIEPGADNMYGLNRNMSESEMFQSIMLERKIEFAFEGKRYWDLRRNKLYATELNGTRRHGTKPLLNMPLETFNEMKDNITDYDTNYGYYFRDSTVVVDTKFDINFKDNYYFYDIPRYHLEKNPNLEQTQGWAEGTFDPLQ